MALACWALAKIALNCDTWPEIDAMTPHTHDRMTHASINCRLVLGRGGAHAQVSPPPLVASPRDRCSAADPPLVPMSACHTQSAVRVVLLMRVRRCVCGDACACAVMRVR